MPIHLIWGDDFGAIDRSIEKFIKKAIDPNWISINLSRLDGQNASEAHKCLEEVRTPPFGNGHRIVIVKKSPFCNGCSNELSNHFESIINLIPEQTHLILVNQNKPDGRLKTTKLLNNLIKSKKAFEQRFILPPAWDGLGQKKLVERTAEEMNIELTEDAILTLVEALGSDSQRIAIELEKLVLLEEAKTNQKEGEKIIISQESVNDLIHSISSNSLQICEFLLKSNFGKAIEKIDYLLNEGEPALRILATMTSQIRGWLWVSLLDQGENKEVSSIAKQAGIANPKRIYVIRKQIQGKSPMFFIELLSRILEIEALLKKGALPKHAFRDGLVTKSDLIV
ncbi:MULTISPECIES: DNA polymerase III subunit delta [Prochlorococcus]|uniref:DNA polymerase III subunit delta n=1 Tax=Prochlorococcus marinus (strain SARG / CCMP1375 / SS120) TaxID=167539 RepID=Q7V9M3_PROMA|nr:MULTISPECIES: DNA polymerase III subunit delta [Prochlorococcus]AAQ00851.1 DNA polymerase III delta subunit [Prochlorococcus marinus subsp. marinus str. CCMP1375]KGG10653.1 DNA polymerasee III [Prochlorococcus marinus str. LG]KGG21252.1 DNA polymerasee III [Prochlorococcus marinus str. SS2]KGG23899.1 DNA polymerasee III [Prochlorococcus marinus str. SS35]KGG31841.1 DNA polymerasee III [Prochlorococcus marinus str. SS51]